MIISDGWAGNYFNWEGRGFMNNLIWGGSNKFDWSVANLIGG